MLINDYFKSIVYGVSILIKKKKKKKLLPHMNSTHSYDTLCAPVIDVLDSDYMQQQETYILPCYPHSEQFQSKLKLDSWNKNVFNNHQRFIGLTQSSRGRRKIKPIHL